ncbi:MAG: helix-turn-helix domain-containing protein, partial [Deltaproteobacteria bacterium]|nr:helix-turn-helix domain-containing protein [Deltaproteobacteria bacterium]
MRESAVSGVIEARISVERLLNVREVAELLNVSQMTIRRWTNAGMLNCYRIGKKRERRFSPRDLQTFLVGESGCAAVGSGTLGAVPIGFAGIEVPDGSHLTHLYLDVQEALGLQESFLRQGLENGETVLVVAPDDRREFLLQTLTQTGLDVVALMSQGRLHHSGGKESLGDQVAYISQVASSAKGRFRLIGDMSWAKRKKWRIEELR